MPVSSCPRTPTAWPAERPRASSASSSSRFLHQRLAILGLFIFAGLGIASILVGHFWQYSYTEITNNLNDPPSWTNPFGTNSIGNDMFAQVMAGVEKDIQIALTVAAMATLIGVTVGAIAGFYRGWVDSLLMRFVDLVLVLPVLAVLIVLSNKLSKESNNWLGSRHHHRPPLVDLRGPPRPGRLPVAART